MQVIRFKKVIFSLFFICGFLNSLLWGSEIEVPLPDGSIQILEKSANIGTTKAYVKSYATSLSDKKLKSFFDKEMISAGWRKEKNNIFMKEDYCATISIINLGGKDNQTRFSILTVRIPKEEEFLASRKAIPDKVDFMPIYPGSTQNFFWGLPVGANGSYETKSNIKDVIFFYKSGMLNYGWNLANETPLKTEKINCPECEKAKGKLPAGAPKFNMKGSSSKAVLVFHRGDGEICKIDLYQNILDLEGVDPALVDSVMDSTGKTIILVTYYANKKINP